jgi:hypothetical protein
MYVYIYIYIYIYSPWIRTYVQQRHAQEMHTPEQLILVSVFIFLLLRQCIPLCLCIVVLNLCAPSEDKYHVSAWQTSTYDTHTHTHTHARTHAHTHAHARTYTHMPKKSQPQDQVLTTNLVPGSQVRFGVPECHIRREATQPEFVDLLVVEVHHLHASHDRHFYFVKKDGHICVTSRRYDAQAKVSQHFWQLTLFWR